MDTTTIDKTRVVKFVARTVVGSGVGLIVKDIITNNTNLPEGRYRKVAVIAGAAVIGMMAKDASKAYVDSQIDQTVATINEFKNKIKDAQTETPVSE
jgi:uncharacterized protein YcfJ